MGGVCLDPPAVGMGGRAWEAGVLPAEVTRFIGRRQEMSQARALMSRGRLVTLTGPGWDREDAVGLSCGSVRADGRHPSVVTQAPVSGLRGEVRPGRRSPAGFDR